MVVGEEIVRYALMNGVSGTYKIIQPKIKTCDKV